MRSDHIMPNKPQWIVVTLNSSVRLGDATMVGTYAQDTFIVEDASPFFELLRKALSTCLSDHNPGHRAPLTSEEIKCAISILGDLERRKAG